MKGIVFTLDAIFALIIATSSIAILLYFAYPTVPYSPRYTFAQSVLSSLLNTNVSSIASASAVAQAIVVQNSGVNGTWPQYGQSETRDASGTAGPMKPYLDYVLTPGAAENTSIIADYGDIYAAYGKVMYAYNATTGARAWSKSTVTNIVSQPLLYAGTLIYANSTSLVALNAFNGSQVWAANIIGLSTVTTPLLAYDGEIFFGTSAVSGGDVFAYAAANGTQIWSASMAAYGSPVYTAICDGSLVVSTSNFYLYVLTFIGNTPEQLWTPVSYSGIAGTIATYNNLIAFGSGTSAKAIYINGTSAFSQSMSGTVEGVSEYHGMFIYQSATQVAAYTATKLYGGTLGTQVWSFTPQTNLEAYVNGTPIEAGGRVYVALQPSSTIDSLNASTGSLQWATTNPYASTLRSFLTLAYGRLFVLTPFNILAYGACPSANSDSIIYAAAYAYLNGRGDCASALLNSVNPLYNYTLFINNTFIAGNVAYFNGNNYILIGDNGTIETNAYSWSFWMKPTAWPAANNGILTESSTSPGSPYMIEQSNGTNRVQFSNDGGIASYAVYAPATLNAWQHIVGTFNYVTGTISIYKNGALVASKKEPLPILGRFTNGDMFIGFFQTNEYFQGSIANVQIYNSSLSQSQVLQLYQEGISGGPLSGASLSAWYPLDGGANDYGPYNNTGYPETGIYYAACNCLPLGYTNAFEVSAASVIQPITGNLTGTSKLYGVRVVSWR